MYETTIVIETDEDPREQLPAKEILNDLARNRLVASRLMGGSGRVTSVEFGRKAPSAPDFSPLVNALVAGEVIAGELHDAIRRAQDKLAAMAAAPLPPHADLSRRDAIARFFEKRTVRFRESLQSPTWATGAVDIVKGETGFVTQCEENTGIVEVEPSASPGARVRVHYSKLEPL